MSMWGFRTFSDPGFHDCFRFFRSVDLNKDAKRCLNALHLNLSCTWNWSMAIVWAFLADLCAIMCVKKSKLHQYKPSN